MQAITTIGFDIAKLVFQVHGVDAAGQMKERPRNAGRGPPNVLGLRK
jgi:transposase